MAPNSITSATEGKSLQLLSDYCLHFFISPDLLDKLILKGDDVLLKKSRQEKHIPAPEETQRALGIEWQTPVSTNSAEEYVPIGKSINEETVKK